MTLNAYLRLSGETQGEIRGSVAQAGREDSIMVIGFHHLIAAPHHVASGLSTGKRQHSPLVVTKEVDKSTPLLYTVLVNNENITDWSLDFWRPSRSGKEFQFYTIELTNASITSIEAEMLNNRYPEDMKHLEREHVSFTYQKITWTWQDGAITSEDDWEAPVV